MIVLDGCKMAFLAIRFLNGSVSYDTSAWEDIRSEAQRLKRLCGAFAAAPLGGNLVVGEFEYFKKGVLWLTIVCAGDHSRLAMILYAPGSIYDDVVKADLAAGTVVVADEEDEPRLGIVKPNRVICEGEELALDHSMSCNRTEEMVDVSQVKK